GKNSNEITGPACVNRSTIRIGEVWRRRERRFRALGALAVWRAQCQGRHEPHATRPRAIRFAIPPVSARASGSCSSAAHAMVNPAMAKSPVRRRAGRPQPAVVAEPTAHRRTRVLVAAGVGALAFLAYVLTAARDIFPGDTAEFVTVALTGGVAHSPGYPLLSAIGVIFGLLPLGPLAFRIDLIAVICQALTVVIVFLTMERVTRNLLASAAAAVVFAFGTLFWSWALIAEAFSLNDLLAASVIYALVVWHDRPDDVRWLFGAGAAFGLGLANHQTILLLVPAIAYALYTD